MQQWERSENFVKFQARCRDTQSSSAQFSVCACGGKTWCANCEKSWRFFYNRRAYPLTGLGVC
jgi:hypothetical protein